MPVVNPGIRRLLASAIQRLFNGASFSAPLTHSLVPERGTGSPTFTRATTATVRDNEGVLRTAIAGEARFEGARRVRNLLTYTENFSNAAWTKTATAVSASSEIAPDGTTSAVLITDDGTVANHGITQTITPTGPSRIASVYAKAGTGSFIQFYTDFVGTDYANFNLSTGTVGTVGATATASISSEGNGWYRCSICTGSSASQYITVKIVASGTSVRAESRSSAQTVNIWHPQLEDITGRTDQTTPSEYVSVGVESAPLYHGSGVDGVKCFATDINGAAIPSTTLLGYVAEGARTNLCLQSNDPSNASWTKSAFITTTQNAVSPVGATNAWTITATAGATFAVFLQNVTVTADTSSYTASCFVKKTTGTPATYPMFEVQHSSATKLAGVVINTTTGTLTNRNVGGAIVAPDAKTITSYNDTWWRVTVTLANNSGTVSTIAFYPSINSDGTGTIVSGTLGSAVFYGAQLELGSFASSYIPTTTIAVARNADVEAVSTSGNIAAAAGSVYLEYTPTHSPSGTIAFWGTYVDASNYTAIIHDATNLIFRKRIAGVNYDATIANAFVSGTTYKACATWGASGTSITLNGTEGTPHANTTAAQIAATMQWGADGNSLQQPFASVRNCRDWLRQLSASERAAVTA